MTNLVDVVTFGEPPIVLSPEEPRFGRVGSDVFGAQVPQVLVPGYLASAKYLHLTGITAALSDSCREAVHSAISAARSAGVHRDLSGRGMKKGPPEQEVPLCA